MKNYKMKTVGVFLARMQPVHKAHLFMVTKACEECDEVCVILGSENKKDTLRNPFTIEKRREMLLESLPKEYRSKISVYEIPDWSMETKTEDDKIWGRYFYYNVVSRIGQKHFKLYYSDGIDNLNSWFDEEIKQYVEYRLFERSSLFAGLSATKIRQAFVDDNKEYIDQFCPKVVMDNFDYLRNYYLGVVDKPKRRLGDGIMTAQEMFEKLGYVKTCHDEREIIYSIYNDNVLIAEIEFDLQDQTFYCVCLDEAMEVDMKVLKAINQQCKELGWLDE